MKSNNRSFACKSVVLVASFLLLSLEWGLTIRSAAQTAGPRDTNGNLAYVRDIILLLFADTMKL